jgi:signal transduction histidine kinase
MIPPQLPHVQDPLHRSLKLLDVCKQVTSERELSEVVQHVTDVSTELIGAEFGSFFYNVIDSSGESYTLYTLSGVPREAFSQFPMPRATHLFGPTFRGEATIVSGDIKRDPRFGKNPPYHGLPKGHLPVTSYLATPVIAAAGKVHGGLFFGHSQPNRFSEIEVKLVETMAAHTAIALDNRDMIKELRASRQTAEEAARANKELYDQSQAASIAKDRFISTLSHELRTPLTPALTALQLLESEPALPPQLNDLVQMAIKNIQQEVVLVGDLLDLSRLQHDKMELNVNPFDFGELVQEVVDSARMDTRDRNQRLHLRVDVHGLMVRADRSRVCQAMSNLIANALKFSPPASDIWIDAYRERDHVHFRVRDEGIGMDRETLDRIFLPFEQGDRKITKAYGGLGLGLTISSKLVALHGGTITAESDGPQKGATFVLRLPIANHSAIE